ncbi:hypothetical protein BDQ12DRAFT_699565 [Crucibulum laeve]|uniref:DUF6535 domain-containing protein n=1 Tax=Crucibulum laeve TaxID=68775 RepID=A0A5C3LUS3_9AGAR|nr:hypothetical protein BDQ12DRAFT_699565 [Crucibulum laeve]
MLVTHVRNCVDVPDTSAIRVNIFWFLSLVLSLATVLIGTLCMQWLREYERDASLSHKESIGLRHIKYCGLLAWHVPAITAAALVLFFGGLLDFPWQINNRVAIPITVIIGLTLFLLAFTTMSPTLQCIFSGDFWIAQCPYKSPQSFILLRLTYKVF